jgi:hypothetical protein
MSPISENQKTVIIALPKEGKLGREQIAAKAGVSPGTIIAIKAHLTMGTYTEPSEAEEVIEAMETTFGLERNTRLLCAPTSNSLSKDSSAAARLASPSAPPAGGTVGAVAG